MSIEKPACNQRKVNCDYDTVDHYRLICKLSDDFNMAVYAASARFPTSNRYCTGGGGHFILLFNLLSLKLASLHQP